MTDDAHAVEAGRTLRSDVCIIGGGAAGITIARELAKTSLRVILLESGGFGATPETQSLYEGKTLGAPQWPLHSSRLRLLGGSTNHWTGISRPFDEADLLERPWVPHSGWPLSPKSLQPYYRKAFAVCRLASYSAYLRTARARLLDPGAALAAEGVVLKLAFQTGGVRFGSKYRKDLEEAKGVLLLLHANAYELVPDRGGRRVENVEVRTLTGHRFFVASRAYVLACGAIENARLLLLSKRASPRGLGNDHDLVGRYYADHPAAKPLGLLQFFGEGSRRLVPEPIRRSTYLLAGLSLRPEVQQREKLLNSAVYTFQIGDIEVLRQFEWLDPHDENTLRFLQKLGPRRGPVEAAFCWLESEQAPNPNSRVTLTDEVDRLGQRRVAVDWRLLEIDRHSLERTARLWAEIFGRSGSGRVKLRPWLLGEEVRWWRQLFPGGWHAMGTTRMADDARRGVVDPNCRVFGLDNLYVAGSSVFPTGGYDSPTVKLVALAIRLADHLATTLAH